MKVVCDELGHNTATKFAIMKKLLSEMKMVTPDLRHIHYYTDSPTLQYRNKSIFYIVSRQKSLFDVSASWNYFEAGHRKGPCDGVGGLVKRMADKAVKQQKVVIEDAQDFFSCTQQHMCTSSMSFIFVSQEDCKAAQQEIDGFGELKAMPGTMKIHALSDQPGQIVVRETSCYCEHCFTLDSVSVDLRCKWQRHHLTEYQPPGRHM